MRDYVIIAIVLATLPIGLVRPFWGFIAYVWISYMNPHMYAWSFAQSFPVAKLSALSVVCGMVVTRTGDLRFLRQRENVMMMLAWAAFTFSTLFAIYDAWDK